MSIPFSDFLRNFIDTLNSQCYIQDTEINKKQIGGKNMKSSIGEILKKCRLESGKSVKDISDLLKVLKHPKKLFIVGKVEIVNQRQMLYL